MLATHQSVGPKACPHCGKAPRVIPTLVNTYYIACLGHAETKGCNSKEEAIDRWNRDEYDEEVPQQIH